MTTWHSLSRAKGRARLERHAIPASQVESKRRFDFVVSPTTTHGVDVALPLRIGHFVRKLIEQRNYSCELSGIVVFPIIADPKTYAQPNFMAHKRSENGYFVGMNIDFKIWQRARAPGRVKLTRENFAQAVAAIPNRHMSAERKGSLCALIEAASKQARK